jgi:glycosyltransferase involved in cell wall biosynthesis
MRVLYLSNAAEIGGANRALLTLWRGLAAQGISPTAVCPADGPMVRACAADNVPCRVFPYRQPSWREPRATWRLIRDWRAILAAVDPHVVHANDLDNARSVALAASSRGLPVVCHIRFHREATYLRWVFRGLPKPKAFVYNSHATRDRVEPALRAACPRAAHIVIHNGVSLERFTPAVPPRQDPHPVRIGIVGNLLPIKGHLEFLDMAGRLTSDGLDAEYWIVGDDIHRTGYRATLEARARELALASRVTFLGHRSDIPDLMRQLDIMVCASHVEPFGINVIEGMACALPVVGTTVGGIPEIIQDGVTGYLVPPGNSGHLAAAVYALARDPVLRHDMGQRGLSRARHHFSEQQYTTEVVRLYGQVVTRGWFRTADT